MFYKNLMQLTKAQINFNCFFKGARLTLLSFLTLLQNAQTTSEQPQSIGILQIVAHPALDKTQRGIVDGLKKKYPDIKITLKIAQGHIINATMISQKFVSDGVDAIVVLGTAAAQVAAKAAQLRKTPVVFASITDPLEAKLVKDLEKPGGIVTGVSNYTEQLPQLLYFRKLIPTLKRLGFIYNPGEANSVTLLKKTTEAARELGIEIVPAAVMKTTEVSMATQKLMGAKIDGIFINNDNTALAAFDVIAQICQKFKVPLFVSDTDMVPQGALGSLGPDQYTIGLQCADIVSEVLEGVNPATLPVQFPAKKESYLNLKVAKALGLQFSPELIKEIEQIIQRPGDA